jgi:uncharacterized protein YjbK
MERHTEVELKWALDARAYDRLAVQLETALGPARVLAQENRFFDTADQRLRRERMNLRLRRENGALLLTCKRRAPSQGEEHRHDEWEEWIAPSLWDRIGSIDLVAALPLPAEAAQTLGGAPLVDLGGFANRRLEHRNGDELLCLDRTDYGTRIDHELEIETPRPEETALAWSGRLREWGVAFRRQSETKFARFLALGSQRPPGTA